MAEYIGCRDCSSPNCKGCNVYTLETMLKNGKFDCLMNGNRSVNPRADVAPVVRGEWANVRFLTTGDGRIRVGDCPLCKSIERTSNFCPNCGAKMKE